MLLMINENKTLFTLFKNQPSWKKLKKEVCHLNEDNDYLESLFTLIGLVKVSHKTK